MGIAGIITAIATTLVALFEYGKAKRGIMNPVQIKSKWKIGDYVFIHLQIFPAKYQSTIRKISSNAEGMALWDEHAISDRLFITGAEREHYKSIALDLDFLPESIAQDSAEFVFSIKLRKAQKSLFIKLYKSSSLFTEKRKLTIEESITTD